ncbi:hypothetical protein CQW23_12484 [Capsicum baccatum]|uniref:CG-1 domain-containing protein n=1 Tax=Capsicum baccatum TaxID=33114 RepID=A0A2G2WSN3_CAPBA|nr:hypothetical protein CQW23_12484 [Capsicum baccatum]
MLRCLYDDVIEVEAIQSMLNRRIMVVENTDFYGNLKSCNSKYRRATMNVVSGGFVFLFNRKVLIYFRKDGHNWRKKDGKTIKEAQEKLEIGKRSSEFPGNSKEIKRKARDLATHAVTRVVELTSENFYGTMSSAIMKLPDTNSVDEGLNRDLDSQLMKTMSSSFLINARTMANDGDQTKGLSTTLDVEIT